MKSLGKKLVVAILMIACMTQIVACKGEKVIKDDNVKKDVVSLASAVYPGMKEYPDQTKVKDWDEYQKKYDEWDASREAFKKANAEDPVAMEDFLTNSIKLILNNGKDENAVYSPVNLYLALSMLAEITDGESRKQVLDAMGVSDIDTLRKNVELLWNKNYSDDGLLTSILGNSVWLRNDSSYNEETLKRLAEKYYASSFAGTMGDPKYDKELQNWLNKQTGNLLKNQIDDITFTKDTVLALCSAIYYCAQWNDKFYEDETTKEVFHKNGSDITCDFMHQSQIGNIYNGDDFLAYGKSFQNAGSMYFILPNEGKTPADLLNSKDAMKFIVAPSKWEKFTQYRVNFATPKFDVSSQTDLIPVLNKLGIEDVMNSGKADFTNIVKNIGDVVLTDALHGARVKIDEDGCEAAAYTVMMMKNTAFIQNDEMDFVLDRPFIFVVTSNDGTPLFTGVVNSPVEK